MPKSKNLNGLPHNLVSSYLSTLVYYNGGYMADWLNYIAREKAVKKISVNILTKQIIPKETEIKPLQLWLDHLNEIINKELERNGFEKNFIKKAVMHFEIPLDSDIKIVYCEPELVDSNGKSYKLKTRLKEYAYEIDFNPIQKLKKVNFIDRLKSFFK